MTLWKCRLWRSPYPAKHHEDGKPIEVCWLFAEHGQGSPAFEATVPLLSQLLEAELAERQVRSIAYHPKLARFPVYRDLADFDFVSSEVNESLVRQLHRCEFLEGANNVVLVGGPGTGKSHLATAFGVQAIEHHRKKVRFFSTVELVNALEQEKARGKAGSHPRMPCRSLQVLLLMSRRGGSNMGQFSVKIIPWLGQFSVEFNSLMLLRGGLGAVMSPALMRGTL